MKITKCFSWHKNPGGYAEDHLTNKFFPSLGLDFEKIPASNVKTPEGWILQGGKRIALAEIKLIEASPKNDVHGVHRITIDKPIQDALRRAKKQLKNIDTKLPKILYLIFDDAFANSKAVLRATFGPLITIERKGQVIYNGPRGFHPTKKVQQDNKILGSWLSAIFCYVPDTQGYQLFLFQPQNPVNLPIKLMPTEAIQEIWEYGEGLITQKK